MIKIIFSDMDGTLLDENGNLPAEFDEVMAELAKRNVLFAPASGRQYFSLIKTFPDYVDRFLFLSDNGTIVREQGKILFSNAMNKNEGLSILKITENIPEICEVYCGRDKAYLLNKKCPQKFIDEVGIYFGRCEFVDDFSTVDDEIVKASFYIASGEAEQKIYPLFKEYRKDYQVVLASLYWVDIMNLDANKGEAVQAVQKRLNIKPEECAAFGDYMNDREMLGAVYHSYAMENAYPAIKDIARNIAPSNSEHGVMQTIKKFMAEGLL